jgi:hypothetical protein
MSIITQPFNNSDIHIHISKKSHRRFNITHCIRDEN